MGQDLWNRQSLLYMFFLAGYPANETGYHKRPDIRCNPNNVKQKTDVGLLVKKSTLGRLIGVPTG